MSDSVNIMQRAVNVTKAPRFAPYSKVIIHVGTDEDGNEVVYESGDDSGRVLEISNEWGSQQMADNIISKLRGFEYQPVTAKGALIDPAFELGDGVTVNGLYTGIFTQTTRFDQLMASDVAAPVDEEIEHEYGQETATNRAYTRFIKDTKAGIKLTYNAIEAEVQARTDSEDEIRATLSVQADNIAAKVSKVSDSGSSSFGWQLLDDQWNVFSGSENNVVFHVDRNGATVKGQITATSGYIGNGSNGFTITSNAIYNNISQYGGTQNRGVYIGTNGIQLGQGFKVNSNGEITATSGTFGGTVHAGKIISDNANDRINGDNLLSAGSIGSGGGGALSSKCIGGIGGGNNFTSMTTQAFVAEWLCANHIICYSAGSISGKHYGQWADDSQTHSVSWKTKKVGGSYYLNGSSQQAGYFYDTSGQIRYLVTMVYSLGSSDSDDKINYLGR